MQNIAELASNTQHVPGDSREVCSAAVQEAFARMGKKITLGQAKRQGAARLIVCCAGIGPSGYGCHHEGEIRLEEAIARCGIDRRLDDIPFRCAKCGARNPDVRPANAGSKLSERASTWGATPVLEPPRR